MKPHLWNMGTASSGTVFAAFLVKHEGGSDTRPFGGGNTLHSTGQDLNIHDELMVPEVKPETVVHLGAHGGKLLAAPIVHEYA